MTRRSILLASGLAFGSALTACGRDRAGAAGGGGAGGSIDYWFAPVNSEPAAREAFVKYNVAPFRAAHPEVSIEVVYKDLQTINQNLQTALAAGRGPDIIPTPGPSNAVTFARAEYLTPLDAYVSKYSWDDALLPWALKAGAVQGKTYSIPQYYETLVLYYNKSLFDTKGWTPPTTRAELEDIATRAQADGIVPIAAGNADYPAGTEWLVTAFWNHHAGPKALYQALTGKLPWSDPVFVAPIELLKSYVDKGWIAGGAKRYFTNTDTRKYTEFASGKAAMYISGTWEFLSLPDYFGADGNLEEFDFVPVPRLSDAAPADLFELSVGGTLSINSRSKNPDAAATYLDWLIKDRKTMWAQVAETGNSPMPVTFTKDDFPPGIDPKIARQYVQLSEATKAGRFGFTTWTFWGDKAVTYITQNIDKVLSGDTSPAEFCQGVQAAFSDDFDRGLLPAPVEPTA